MSGSSCKSAFIYWTRSDAVISSISFCIAWCSSLPFLGNSSSLFFLFLGHIWKPGQVVPKSYPCSMHLGFPDAHAMGFYSFFTEQDEIYYHHDVLSMPFNVYAFQWSWTTMASLFSWLIIFPCPGWWLCLKPSIFPSAAACTLLTSCLPQPSEQMFPVVEARINESSLISCFREMTYKKQHLLRCCIPATGILSTTSQKNSYLSPICVWLGMYRVWAGLQAHLLMTGLTEVVTGLLGERRL